MQREYFLRDTSVQDYLFNEFLKENMIAPALKKDTLFKHPSASTLLRSSHHYLKSAVTQRNRARMSTLLIEFPSLYFMNSLEKLSQRCMNSSQQSLESILIGNGLINYLKK